MVDTPPLVNPVAAVAASQAVAAEEITVIAASVDNLPETIQQLARQIQLSGTVTSINGNTSFTLQTVAGSLTLSLPPQADGSNNPLADVLPNLLSSQKPISVFIQPGSPPSQAQILVPQTLLSAPVSLIANDLAINKPVLVAPTNTLQAGLKLTAILLPQSVGTVFSTLPNDAAKHLSTPHEMGQMLTNLKQALDATPANSDSAAKLSITPQKSDAVLPQARAEVNVQIKAIALPSQPAPLAKGADEVVATIVGKGPNGQVVVNTKDATLYIRQNSDLPIGSKLLLTLLPVKTDSGALLPPSQDKGANALLNLVAALHDVDPQAAAQLQNRIPQAGVTMPPAMLLLFNALQQGTLPAWIGQPLADALSKAGKRDILSKLIDEIQQATGIARDDTVGEWRRFPMPVHDPYLNQYQTLSLYVHHDQQRQQPPDSPNRSVVAQPTRFIITMKMSQLGAIQMDGLAQKKQLDMVIRSEKPLPETLPVELRTIYTDTLGAIGFAGTIAFQTGRQHWMVLQDTAAEPDVVT